MPDTHPLTIGVDASRSYVAQHTGTERYSRRIVDALLAAAPDHRFILYVNSTPPPAEPPPNATFRCIPFPRLWTHLRLSAELRSHPVDALFVPAHVVPPVHPRTTVVTIHDLGYLHEPGAHTTWARRYLDWSTRWSVRAAARVIAISNATRDDLIRRYRVPAAKIHVIPHGVDEAFRPLPKEEVTAALDRIGLRQPYVLFVGTLQPRKNIPRLIAAFHLMADENPALLLVLAGTRGWLAEQIDAAIADSPHRDRIMLPGHVADGDLPALYSGACAAALPSLYEGFGLPVLEAMACGTPVVVSDRGSLPEVAGSAGIMVDPIDPASIAAGLRCALDPSERSARVEAGLRHAAAFSWRTAALRTLAVIEEAAGLTGRLP